MSGYIAETIDFLVDQVVREDKTSKSILYVYIFSKES